MRKNQFFKFKQFTINQDKSAMKVCTDACIFGAYISVENAKNILDIGTGTGLLAMMIAQRADAKIDAVEIDKNAYNQAVENIDNSIFRGKIVVLNSKIQDFYPNKKYDLIISNPPFYQNSLQSPDNQANKAHHSVSLSFEELIFSVKRLLAENGKFMVLLPPFESQKFEKIAFENDLFPTEKLLIRHSEKRNFFRIITTFETKIVENCIENHLEIYENDEKNYSEKFRNLLKDYYLIF